MRYFKLFIISVIVFSIILFCLSLLFPSTTYVSRAVNVKGQKTHLPYRLPEILEIAFQKVSLSSKAIDLQNETFSYSPEADSLVSDVLFLDDVRQGVVSHNAGKDSTTIQVFYKIHVPFYKPWKKFALMLNESKYGPSLDSAISRISRQF